MVMTRRLPDLLDLARQAAVNSKTSLESLTQGFYAYIMYLLEHPDYLQIHLTENSWGLGPARATSEQLAAWREGLDLYAAVLQAAMDENIEEIEFNAEADLVAVTANTVQAPSAYEIIEKFKARGIQTIIGGIHASVLPHEAVRATVISAL